MTFNGFAPELSAFVNDLTVNNNRERFLAHRPDYEQYFLEPGGELVLGTGECLPGLGAGIHAFSDAGLGRCRAGVLDRALGARLEAAAHALGQQPGVDIGAEMLEGLSPGIPADHPRAEWLRHSSQFAAAERPLPVEQLFSTTFPDVCFAHYERLAPLQQWLVDVLPE